MTREEVRKKWGATYKLVVPTEEERQHETDELLATAKLKIALRNAISCIMQLEEHDCEYQLPWTRNQFRWALAKPTAEDKIKQARVWQHQCVVMRDKACTNW